MKKIYCLSMMVILLNIKVSGQTVTHNNDVWLHYFGKFMWTEKLSTSFETTMRFADGFAQKQQYFIRPSVDYQFTNAFQASVGYSHYLTYVYGETPINKINTPENHVWVQGTFVHKTNDFKFTHRLRDENRYVGIAQADGNGGYAIDHYSYRNRLRYMFTANYSFIKKDKQAVLFGILGDEVFMNIGSNAGKTFLNQNRLIAGLGYNMDKNNQIQACYIHQNIWNFSDTIEESNPTVRLSYIMNIKF